jgi:hypothetical protein
VVLNVTPFIGEHKVKRSLGTRQPPFTQGVRHQRTDWDGSPRACRLRVTDSIEAIGALSDLQFAPVKIHVRPSEPAKFARTHPGKNGRDQEPAPAL